MTNAAEPNASKLDSKDLSEMSARGQTLAYFVLTVLGFSFWFFMAVPFASHRESYAWLGLVHSHGFAHAFTGISSTYRPLHQAATWLGFLILDPSVFPTSVLRQTLFQLFVYCTFVLAWWLIYSAAPQRRLFAVIALVAGGVFFSGYVHLFHIYGNAYIPAILMLGVMLNSRASGTFRKSEAWLAAIATLLVFWHPFTTALFVGFYFGYYVDTFRQRSRAQHLQAATILLIGIVAIVALIIVVPRLWPGASQLLVQTATRPLNTRLFAFLVSYQTNEVNRIASLVAFLLTQLVVISMRLSRKQKLMAILAVTVLSFVFLLRGLPLLLLWICAVLIKLFLLRCWSLFFLALTAALLPFGGGIGSPMYALFAIIVAVYATPLECFRGENALSFVKTPYIVAIVLTATAAILMVRAGIDVPLLTNVANPLLAERERTYQLESILAWLRDSDYCGDDVTFIERADLPIDSVESAITRRNRPPAALEDVQLFWRTVLQCQKTVPINGKAGTAIVTFGGPAVVDARPVFEVAGRYGGAATVWIRGSKVD